MLGDLSQRIIVRAKVKSTRTVAEVRVDVPEKKIFQSNGRHSSVSPKYLRERWQIGIEVV